MSRADTTTGSQPTRIYLAIETGDGSEEQLRIDEAGPVLIGRDQSCHVVLPSPDVSRKHATLEADGSGVRLTDKSANGTYIGDHEQRIVGTTIVIAPGVPFRIGPYRLHVMEPALRRRDTDTFERKAQRNTLPLETRAADLGAPFAPDEPTLPGDGGRSAGTTPPGRRATRPTPPEKPQRGRLVTPPLPAIRQEVQQAHGAPTSSEHGRSGTSDLELGPLEALLADNTVSEIMVVDPVTIFIERNGRIEHTDLRFTDDDAVRSVIERLVTPLGRRIDESNPLVDVRLKDGTRVNAIIPPLALRGPCITIRKLARNPLGITDLIGFGTMTERIARFLERAVVTKKNIVISGGTGSGKTTLLNVLSAAIPEAERIVTIEDAAELRLSQPHVVALEARPPDMEGHGEITTRHLVRNALRMRPGRIVVGECRGGETLDMLQAMNSGHEGSMTTTHAHGPHEAIGRLETLALMGGLDLPSRAIRQQISGGVDLIVQQSRFSDGSRRTVAVSEVLGIDDGGEIEHQDIFRFVRTGTGTGEKIEGEFRATGYRPTFVDDFITHGLVGDGDGL